MPLFSRLLGRMAKIIGRSSTGKELPPLLDGDNEDEAWVVRHSRERALVPYSEAKKLFSPKQLPISAETAFVSHFTKYPQDFQHKTRGPMTIDDAWDDLSLCKRQRYITEAKENDLYNTAKIAEFNQRCPLSPSMEDESSVWTPTVAMSGLDHQWYLIKSRRVALQRWQRYRSDYTAACGGNMPEKPFRIMDLPFELRREIFSLVLRQSYPVLHFPSDGSADVLQGPVDVRLFAVSRQVYVEAVKVFYEENAFSISTDPSIYLKAMPLFMRQSTGSEAPRPTDSIRRVHIIFPIIGTNTDAFRFLWKKFCEFLKTCRDLRTVELSVRARPRDYDGTIDLQIDKLAETLMNTRDIIINISDVTTDGRREYRGALLPIRCSEWRTRGIIHQVGDGG